jgi:aspartate kinase
MSAKHYFREFPRGPIVQKYGGTSVGTVERVQAVAERIAGHVKMGFTEVAIVVSAQAGETNRLVALVEQVNPNPPPLAYDMALAAGEQVSVALLAAALERLGIPTRPLLGFQLGIVTDHFHSKARIKSINVEVIRQAWSAGTIPIIAGFQGTTDRAEITTLGRGGGDTSAAAVAAALGASLCEINTDVDGVYSADPRSVKAVKHLANLDYEVALEMASLGSKVLHPRSVEIGAKYGVPIVVRNSFEGEDSRRTVIMSRSTTEQLESPVVSGISVDKKVTKVSLTNLPHESRLIGDIFEEVSRRSINVDIIIHQIDSRGRMDLGFSIADGDRHQACQAIETYLMGKGLNAVAQLTAESGLAKVSVVGVGMRSHSGVAARAFQALARGGVDILMISTSEIKISCVVKTELADSAAALLHGEFVESSK